MLSKGLPALYAFAVQEFQNSEFEGDLVETIGRMATMISHVEKICDHKGYDHTTAVLHSCGVSLTDLLISLAEGNIISGDETIEQESA